MHDREDHCSVLLFSLTWLKLARYIIKKVSDRFYGIALTIGSKLKQSAALQTADDQHFPTDVVREWTKPTDEDVELGMTDPGGTVSAPFPPMRLARECSY